MKRCILASRHSFIFLTAMALVFAIVGAAVPAGAETWVNVAGVECQAYNNWQADALERSHVRLLNPSSSATSIWVVCSVPRTVANLTLTGTAVRGYLNVFFDASSAVGSAISCGIREFTYSTKDVPGVAGSPLNAVTVTLSRPSTVPGFRSSSYDLTTDYDSSSWNFYTITCNLPPGSGINSIDMLQQ
jgi:hypothetical protein